MGKLSTPPLPWLSATTLYHTILYQKHLKCIMFIAGLHGKEIVRLPELSGIIWYKTKNVNLLQFVTRDYSKRSKTNPSIKQRYIERVAV